MVGNPAGVGVCGIGKKRNKEGRRGKKKTVWRRPFEASKRQLEIENTLAAVPAGRSQRQGQSALRCCLRG